MKAVIFVLTALLAVAGKAHAACSSVPQYAEKIDPVVCPRASFKLPNYEDSTTYYQCTQGLNAVLTAVLTNCATDTYFNYVLQQCLSCADYFPSAQCSSLPIDVKCVPISTTTAAPGQSTTGTPTTSTTGTPTTVSPTTAAPGQSTTGTPTTVSPTTAAPGQSTTVSVPTPQTDAPGSTTTNSSNDDIITPTGTTIAVPQPPSPNEGNVPTPMTPVPTAPTINNGPPTAPSPIVQQ
ncbi:uncharacterized protein Dere_GG16348 [Drosophila erecta]|nr:uncharacterized protein Dere_GG16348 [Drosophila erecta]